MHRCLPQVQIGIKMEADLHTCRRRGTDEYNPLQCSKYFVCHQALQQRRPLQKPAPFLTFYPVAPPSLSAQCIARFVAPPSQHSAFLFSGLLILFFWIPLDFEKVLSGSPDQ
ncbi:hypothetical protein TNIN_81301 [Trichonephila inaurata madagascariensis]|uniref:Uncharacterized protein n=1 Tax=Trichonephila inaurata madagascariensis TaxID=2747483 RepID=A0A8X6XY85_9ARAC|nr:hypothetical protein TNIN_81301 [Trichonephila inaurata madagascariensis]